MTNYASKSKEERLARAHHAKNLLEDEFLTEMLDNIEDRWIRAWANSKPKDADGRELAYNRVQGVKEFRAELFAVMSDAAVIESRDGDNDGD